MKRISIKVAVLATNANGEPGWYYCQVEVLPSEYADGQHYSIARAQAAAVGFEAPMIAIDPCDSAAKNMADIAAWMTAK